MGSTAAPGSHANTLDHAAAMQAAGMVHHAAGVLSHSALVRAAAWSKVGLKADLAAPGPPMGSPAVRGHPGPAATTLSSQLPAVEPSTYSAGGVKQVADAQGGEVCNASSTSTSNSTSVVLDSSSQAAATAQLPNSPLLQGRQRQRHEQAATSAPSLSSQLQRLLHTMLVLEQASQTSAGPSAASLTSRRHQIAAEGGGDTPERRQQELKLAAMLRQVCLGDAFFSWLPRARE